MKSHLLTALTASLLCFGCAVADGPDDMYDDTDAIGDNGEYTPDDDNSQTNAGSRVEGDIETPSVSPDDYADDLLDPPEVSESIACRDMDSREYTVHVAELHGQTDMEWNGIEISVLSDLHRLDWTSNSVFKAVILDTDDGQVVYEYPAGSDGAEGLTADREETGTIRVARFCAF